MELVDTKELIKNTFSVVLALTIITFVVVFIAYGCSGVSDRLKETLTITTGFFGGLATLGAAYIAAKLFNKWTDEQLGITKSQISKEVLDILVKLTSDAETYYFKAAYYADIYEQRYCKDLSKEYLFSTILEARNSHQMKDEYNSKLDFNLIIFFEKIKLYETVFDVSLLSKEDKEFNFTVYFHTINTFLISIIEGDEAKIIFFKKAVARLREDFKIKYYDELIKILRKNITFNDY